MKFEDWLKALDLMLVIRHEEGRGVDGLKSDYVRRLYDSGMSPNEALTQIKLDTNLLD